MSHNITLSNIKINDLSLLGRVVNDLSKGAAALVKEARTFRTYRGQPNVCDAKITMPGPHDIGLVKQSDGSYTVVYDPYCMDRVFTKTGTTNVIGGLLQEYALREAEIKAAQSGMTSQRIEGENGLVTLELTQAA